jgi:4-hydroxybenzoate polyprenyltransferase
MIAAQHMKWIKARDRQACFKAFLHNTWIGAVIFIGIAFEVLI